MNGQRKIKEAIFEDDIKVPGKSSKWTVSLLTLSYRVSNENNQENVSYDCLLYHIDPNPVADFLFILLLLLGSNKCFPSF